MAQINKMNGQTHHRDDIKSIEDAGDVIHHTRTAQSVNIPAEVFEKLYLSPKTHVKGQLRKTFGNPTPVYVLVPPRSSCVLFPSRIFLPANLRFL